MARLVWTDKKTTITQILLYCALCTKGKVQKSILNAQHIYPCGGCTTTAENHVRFHFFQPRTESRGYSWNRFTTTVQLKTGKAWHWKSIRYATQMVGSVFSPNSMNPYSTCLVSTTQAGGGAVMIRGMFSWYTLSMLIPINHCLNTIANVKKKKSDHLHLFLAKISGTSDNKFSVLQRLFQSLYPNPIEQLRYLIDLKIEWKHTWKSKGLLNYVIMLTWTGISMQCFEHLVKSMSFIIEAVIRANRGST